MAEADEQGPGENVPVSKKEKYVPPADDYAHPLLSDLILSEKQRDSLEQVLFTMEHPDIYKMGGIRPYKSYLFNGPPGTGKTYSVKALRNELHKKKLPVLWVPYDTGTYGTAYINMGAVMLQKYFDGCRAAANEGNIVVSFWDEADVIFGSRAHLHSHKEDTKNLETIMKNMNDLNKYSEGIYFFLCTNFPDQMDAAAVRSGRIDKVINFGLPEEEQLKAAYKLYLGDINKKAIYKVCDVKTLDQIVLVSEGFNYADVHEVVESAVRDEIYAFSKNDGVIIEEPPKITQKHLVKSAERLKAERTELGTTYKKRRIGFT